MTIVGPSGTLAFPWQSDTTYYWRVRADFAFDSPWSAVRKFKIDTLAPVALVSPTNGATDVALTPTFSWSPAAGATGYELVVSDDPTFAIITYSRTSTNAVFYSDEELAYSTVYYWKVRPTGAAYPAAGTPYVMGIFTTMAKPTETAAPITVTQTQQTITVSIPPAKDVIPSYLLWIIIAIGAILVIALIVLIVVGTLVVGLLKVVFAVVLLPVKLVLGLAAGLIGLVVGLPLLLIGGLLLGAIVPFALILLLPLLIIGGLAWAILG